ncbi:hypothetical protein [Liquorilactobacillus nagelii]|uniref:hypothetical protein n=1 Tax=Liquorilactobacillus nagelii TaxID=82688 RepID=UPI0039EBFD10
MDNLDFKNIILEPLRQVRLGISEKKLIAKKYDSVSVEDKQNFTSAIGEYKGIVQRFFIDRLYDNYVYALNAEDEDGISLIDYLKNEKGFKEKRVSSFSIKTEEEKGEEK